MLESFDERITDGKIWIRRFVCCITKKEEKGGGEQWHVWASQTSFFPSFWWEVKTEMREEKRRSKQAVSYGPKENKTPSCLQYQLIKYAFFLFGWKFISVSFSGSVIFSNIKRFKREEWTIKNSILNSRKYFWVSCTFFLQIQHQLIGSCQAEKERKKKMHFLPWSR